MVEFDAFRYRLPLRSPLKFGKARCSFRDGMLITTPDRSLACGDAAPLPGFSRETIEDVVAWHATGSIPPSLKFAIDCLRPHAGTSSDAVPVAALLWGDPEDVIDRVELIRKSGHPAVKLKVGQLPIREQADLVRHVRSRLRADQALRLDANRTWPLSEAIEFGSEIGDLDIEFIEEPTRRPSDLDKFFQKTKVPYALDETLVEAADLGAFRDPAALVVKPTLLGGRQQLAAFVDRGIPLIFSSCFESGIGVWHLARLAADYSPRLAAGLDSYCWIDRDLITNRLRMDEGHLVLGPMPEIDWSMVEELDK